MKMTNTVYIYQYELQMSGSERATLIQILRHARSSIKHRSSHDQEAVHMNSLINEFQDALGVARS